MATIYQKTIRPNSGCLVDNSTAGAPTIVGAAPQWGDLSDATYSVIPSRLTGTLGETSRVFAALPAADIVWPQFTVTARVRLMSSATLPNPFVELRNAGDSTPIYQGPDGVGANPTGSPAWIEIPLTGVGPTSQADLVSLMTPGNVHVAVRSPFAFGAGPDGTYTTTVYEIEVLLDKVVISSAAPPCRLIGRGDSLGVGSGRAYPPSKSQQNSPGNRGVSFY